MPVDVPSTSSQPLAPRPVSSAPGASGAGRREPAPAPAARRADPAHPATAPPAHPRHAVLDRGPTGLARLARPPGRRPARDGHRVAPPGVAPVVAVDIARSGRSAPAQRRGAGPDRPDGPREPDLGQRADPRRAAEARHRGQQALGPAVPAAGAGPPAEPDVADLPRQPCRADLGGGSVDGSGRGPLGRTLCGHPAPTGGADSGSCPRPRPRASGAGGAGRLTIGPIRVRPGVGGLTADEVLHPHTTRVLQIGQVTRLGLRRAAS
jgi:hypothetical protein